MNERGRYAPPPTDLAAGPPLLVATILRPEGITGVHTHFVTLLRYAARHHLDARLVTSFSWGGVLRYPAFGLRMVIDRVSTDAGVRWYRHGHGVFLQRALRRALAAREDCVVYAQCPVSAKAALDARTTDRQRVVMAVHMRISQADEWADKEMITRSSATFDAIRRLERDVIPRVDGLVYVSRWARQALEEWLPQARTVPSVVVDNFAEPSAAAATEPLGDLVTIGNLDIVKNHRFLLEVLAAADRRGARLTLDVFGEGDLQADLEARARDLGISDRVRWRGFRRDVRDFLPGFRVYVHASYSESSSLAIMEAMAAGLPIVAAPIGPLTELFEDGVEGRYWSLDSADQAADTLVDLLGSEERLRLAGQASSARFDRDYAVDRVAPDLLSFVTRIGTGTTRS